MNTSVALVDGTYYHGPLLMCQDCQGTFGAGGRTYDELVMEERERRKQKRKVVK